MRSPSRLLVLLCVFAIGCSDDPVSPQNDLAANRHVWANRGYTVYSFTIEKNCECLVSGPIHALVVHDSVIDAMVIGTGQLVDPHGVPSIEGLFDFIDRGISNHAAVLDVTYDPSRGFPSRIVYDGSATAVDDEITYTVSDVKAASPSLQRRDLAIAEPSINTFNQ